MASVVVLGAVAASVLAVSVLQQGINDATNAVAVCASAVTAV